MPAPTASQTIGPYWHLIEHAETADLTRHGAGPAITLTGHITDGDGTAVADAAVELWQTDPPADARFPGYGRARTDAAGAFRFRTVRPGPTASRGNVAQAPHVALTIFARGLMKPLFTRLYFADEALNETDPLLNAVPPARRGTLIAHRVSPDGASSEGTSAAPTWRLDIRLQGADETVFLDF